MANASTTQSVWLSISSLRVGEKHEGPRSDASGTCTTLLTISNFSHAICILLIQSYRTCSASSRVGSRMRPRSGDGGMRLRGANSGHPAPSASSCCIIGSPNANVLPEPCPLRNRPVHQQWSSTPPPSVNSTRVVAHA